MQYILLKFSELQFKCGARLSLCASGFQVLCNIGQQVSYNCNVLLTPKPPYIFQVTVTHLLLLLWSFVHVNVSLCRNKGLGEVRNRPERTGEKRSISQCSVSSV